MHSHIDSAGVIKRLHKRLMQKGRTGNAKGPGERERVINELCSISDARFERSVLVERMFLKTAFDGD
jgi:hypothetical protein